MPGSSQSSDPLKVYAEKVSDGTIPAGKWQIASCRRHLKDLEIGKWRYRPELAQRAFDLFGKFRHYKGKWGGQPILLEPWQRFVVGSIMGWTNGDGTCRRFRHSFVEVPRGNGKSTLAGGLLVMFGFFLDEPGSESYSVATKKDQARISFQAGRQMLLRAPKALKKHVTISKYNIHSEASESKMEALGADADTLDGLRPFFVCVDEVHKLKSADLVDVMESGMGTRESPHLFEITTAGEDDMSVYGQHQLLTTRVLDGLIELDDYFGFIAAADAEDDWTLEETARKANPNYGVSVNPAFLTSERQKALANPAEQAKFRRLYLGQKVTALESYFSLDDWKACPQLPDEDDLRNVPCWIGLDLSSSIDVTAAVIVWKLKDDEWALKPHFWLPADNLEDRGHRDRVPYGQFAASGLLTITEGNTIDRPRLRHDLVSMAKKWRGKAVCYDPWHAQELVQNMQDQDGLKMLPVPQNFGNLSQAMKDMQAKILQRRVRHDHNPLMSIMIANVVPRHDEKGNVLPSKKRSRGRIDGPQATLNALTQIIQGRQESYRVFFVGGSQ